MLEIHLLGQFRVRVDGHPVSIPERPAQSLLAYLVLNADMDHRREKLAGMLWPEATETNARKYLRHALWRIRKSLREAGVEPDSFLDVSEISLGVNERSTMWLDVHELLSTDATGDHAQRELVDAVRLYRGELLPGFFEDWTSLERERSRVHFQHLIQRLLDLLLGEKRWQEAQEWGERWIALGEVPEPAYRALMVAHAAAGDRAGAVAVYQRAVEDLERELGVDPSPVLRSTLADVTEPMPRALVRRERLRAAEGHLRGELRWVTILQVDLVGLGSAVETTDLELHKDLLDTSVSALVEMVVRYEGTVVRVREQGLVACFGAPIAHEDDTQRALLAALTIRSHFTHQSKPDLPLSSRIGIESGELLVGELGWDLRLGYTAVGEAVDVAARLRTEAQKDEILVGVKAQEEALSSFEFDPARSIDLEGRSVSARPLVLFDSLAGSTRVGEDRARPLVGRETDLATALDAVTKEQGGAVLLVGAPGIGKSRLIEEVRSQTTDLIWAHGNCLSYGASLAYHPFVEVINGLLGTSDNSDRELARQRVQDVLVPLPNAQQGRFRIAISGLLGLTNARDEEPRSTAIAVRDLADALLFLAGEHGGDQPSVIALEDLHWADRASIALIREVLDRPQPIPLVFLLSTRPVRESPAWQLREDLLAWNAPGFTEIHLERLGETALATLVESLAPLPSRVKDMLIRRCGGNPFFMEQLHHAVVDHGVLISDERRGAAKSASDFAEVPTTVRKVILARADRLTETARWVLQAASVLGWRFHASLLERVAEMPVSDALKLLERADFVKLLTPDPEPVYVFSHWLTRDAIYSTLLLSDKRRLHLRAGRALETFVGNQTREHSGLLVYHYVLAGEPEWALPFASAMAGMAWQAISPEAADTYEHALEQGPPPELKLRLLIGLSRARFTSSDIDGGLDASARAICFARELGDTSTMADAMAHAAMMRWQITESREARWADLETALAEISDAPSSNGTLLLLLEAARQHLVAGDVDRAADELAAAERELPTGGGDDIANLESHFLNTKGLLTLRNGSFEAGQRYLLEALRLAEETNAVVATSRSRTNLATSLIDVFGRLGEGIAQIDVTREAVFFPGMWQSFVEETVHLARVNWGEGGVAKGLAEIELLSTTIRGQPVWLPWMGAKAPLLAAQGHVAAAISAARDAWAVVQRTGDELATRHCGLWLGRALGYAGRAEQALPYLWNAATAAIGAPAIRAEALAEWLYAASISGWAGPVEEGVRTLEAIPELSSYVTTWKRIGLAVESSDSKGILDSADYLEEIGQEYVAWLYRYRAAAFMANASKTRVRWSAESWANDRGLVVY